MIWILGEELRGSKEPACNMEDLGSIPGQGRSHGEGNRILGEFHGQRSLADYSSWGHKEPDRTEQLTLSFFFFFPLVSS